MKLLHAYIWKHTQPKVDVTEVVYPVFYGNPVYPMFQNPVCYKDVFDISYENANLQFVFLKPDNTRYWYHTFIHDIHHPFYIPPFVSDSLLNESIQNLAI